MIYLSGPITHTDKNVQDSNLERFFEVEKCIGEKCFNPARLEQEGKSYESYLVEEILWIIENRPTMYMMTGWETSKGARIEKELAEQLGLNITYESK